MTLGPEPGAGASGEAERWRRTEALFHAALELAPWQRTEFLAKLAGDDAALRGEVEALLAADSGPVPLLDRPASLSTVAGSQPTHAARPELAAGERVGAYRVRRRVGQGGTSAVYLAADDAGAELALKVVSRRQPVPGFAERFQREVRLARRLRHPNVLPVIDAGETEQLLWLATPFVAGGTLRDRLRREGRLAVADALRLGRDVAEALSYAHSQGVAHRDVKPENVLLAEDGAPLLTDFGISRALRPDDPDGGRLTATGVLLGTPDYMSPEQLAGDPVDHRTDLYSLGCVLHELLAGRPPFAHGSRGLGLWRRLSQAPPSVRGDRPEVPAAVEAAIRWALARYPQERPESARAFAAVLADALAASG